MWCVSKLFCLGLLALGSCGAGAAGTDSNVLRVFGAASLREVLDGPVPGFESGMSARRVSTGGSNLVAEQLLSGANADVFVSAGLLEMQRLVDAGLVEEQFVRAVLGNRLVVIGAVGQSEQMGPFGGLGDAERISLAHPEAVPAGRFAKAWLTSIGLWADLKGRTVDAVDVRAALGAVASGAVELGVVYRSDALQSGAVQVVHEVVDGPSISYWAAPLVGAADPERAARFVSSLANGDPDWVRFLEARGFDVLGEGQ